MGTVFNDEHVLRGVIDALRALSVRALVTSGPGSDAAALDPGMSKIRVAPYVPQGAVLPHSTAVITHGGAGSTLGSLAFGLPQLCLPQGADQFLNASAVSAAGAALTIAPDEFSSEAVGNAMMRLLDEPGFRLAAIRIRDSLATMQPADEIAAELEHLT